MIKMKKIVINLEPSLDRFSDKALRLLAEKDGVDYNMLKYMNTFEQHHAYFHYGSVVDIVEELGEDANGAYSCLIVVEVPDHYYGIVDKGLNGAETVKFQWKEDYLRELIKTGNEDDIVNYIKGKLY
jgi:hypothetical protein